MSKMRVLISAYAFSPYRGSESAVGWNIAKELAAHCDVTVICGDLEARQDVKHDLEKWKQSGETIPNLHISYVGPTKLIKFIEKIHNLPGCWALYYLAYRLWQKLAYKRALKLHRENPFDLVHHLTMIGYREPGYMWKLPIPFVWGPVGGGPDEPLSFWRIYSLSARMRVVIRNVLNILQKHVLIRPRAAARKASKIWAATEADEHIIRDIWGCNCERMIETAVTPIDGINSKSYKVGEALDIVWSGTHTYGKALPILIDAVSEVLKKRPTANINVIVLGTGGETNKWKSLAKRKGVENSFKWIGFVPRAQAIKIMNGAHVTVFTSLKEGTPHVILESLALGLPVICHDACGMGTVITNSCGIKISMKNPNVSVRGFADAIMDVLTGKIVLGQLSTGASKRAYELTWTAKARQIYSAYTEVVENVRNGVVKGV